MLNGYALTSVNEATECCAPEEALDQIGQVLPRIIAVMAEAPLEGGDIVLMKTDIKDGFWRMVCAEGFEWHSLRIRLAEFARPTGGNCGTIGLTNGVGVITAIFLCCF